MALDNDVHAVVILGSTAQRTHPADLMQALASSGGEDILLALDHLGVYDRSADGSIRWLVPAPAWFRPHACWTLLNIYGKRTPPRSGFRRCRLMVRSIQREGP